MCGGICGPTGQDYNTSNMCNICFRDLRMCNCMAKARAAAKKGGLKKRVNKNRKLTKPLRSKRPHKGA